MQIITTEISDAAVNELCAATAKQILAEAGSSEEMPDREMGQLVFAAAQQAERRLARIGKAGPWCVFCGVDEVHGFCSCPFPADFRCYQRFVCEPCRKAHLALAEHILKMLSFPVVERADSRRSRYEMQLYRAARHVCNPADSDDYDHTEQRDLAFHLAKADAFGDPEAFRAGVLRAFRVSKFIAYQELAVELEKQKHETLLRAIRRAIRWQKGKIRREKLAAAIVDSYARELRDKSTMDQTADDAEFYR